MQTSKLPVITIETVKYEKLKLYSQVTKKSVSQTIRDLIDSYFENEKKTKKKTGTLLSQKYKLDNYKGSVTSKNYKKHLYS